MTTQEATTESALDARSSRASGDGLLAFVLLAYAITSVSGFPLAYAWLNRVEPTPPVMALAGLTAFGPTIAALVVAGRRRELRDVFGRWRTSPVWILVAPFVCMAVHVVATALYVILGGKPAQWLYPPALPQHYAALLLFSVFEEFGWRGFAYPRFAKRYGPVIGSAILGAIWALWHLVMLVSPDTGKLDLIKLVVFLVDLPLYSIVMAWFFERGKRSMAVAIALHVGAHLDNPYRGAIDVPMQGLRFIVVAIAAALAARALMAKPVVREGEAAPA